MRFLAHLPRPLNVFDSRTSENFEISFPAASACRDVPPLEDRLLYIQHLFFKASVSFLNECKQVNKEYIMNFVLYFRSCLFIFHIPKIFPYSKKSLPPGPILHTPLYDSILKNVPSDSARRDDELMINECIHFHTYRLVTPETSNQTSTRAQQSAD